MRETQWEQLRWSEAGYLELRQTHSRRLWPIYPCISGYQFIATTHPICNTYSSQRKCSKINDNANKVIYTLNTWNSPIKITSYNLSIFFSHAIGLNAHVTDYALSSFEIQFKLRAFFGCYRRRDPSVCSSSHTRKHWKLNISRINR